MLTFSVNCGIMTIISTNGIELMRKKEILNYIDSINLPLDSFNPEIHNLMRPCAVKNHHGLILELIEYIILFLRIHHLPIFPYNFRFKIKPVSTNINAFKKIV